MPLSSRDPDRRERAVLAVLAMFNVAMVPLFASMIIVFAKRSSFGRLHSFQFAALLVAVLMGVLRWNLRPGLFLNGAALLIAGVAFFWSPEPRAYLTYTGGLLAGFAAISLLIYLLTRNALGGGTRG